jgi:hypothetical protein
MVRRLCASTTLKGQTAGSNLAPERLQNNLLFGPANSQIWGPRLPITSDTTKKTRNTKKHILAIIIALPSNPQKPNTPASNATIKKTIAKRNIAVPPLWNSFPIDRGYNFAGELKLTHRLCSHFLFNLDLQTHFSLDASTTPL